MIAIISFRYSRSR